MQILETFNPTASSPTSSTNSTIGRELIFYSHSYPKHKKASGGECPVCLSNCGYEIKSDRVVFCSGLDKKSVDAPQEGPGYSWIKTVSQESWSGYISYSLADTGRGTSETREQREARDATARYNAAQRVKEEAFRISQIPENSDRDSYYRSVLSPLKTADIEDLVKRGLDLTEIDNAVSLGFIGRGPMQYNKSSRDFLVLSQIDGQIVGGQIAVIKKYLWDNHKFSTHLKSTDRNPHFECAAIKTIPNTSSTKIVTVEGFLKALVLAVFAAREGLDWYVLGFAGGDAGNTGLSGRIAELKAQFPGIQSVICPDGDVAVNRNVYQAYSKVTKLNGSYDSVLWFGQNHKGHNIDDVDANERSSAKFISIPQYWALIHCEIGDAKLEIADRYDATNIEAGYEAWVEKSVVGVPTLDASQTGDGKSRRAPMTMKMSVERGFKAPAYISQAFRNDNAVKEAERNGEIVRINGRHNGLIEFRGNIRARRSGEVQNLTEAPNCFKADSINAKRSKGAYDDDSVFEQECLKCPLFRSCSNGQGAESDGTGYGYLHSRKAIEGKTPMAMHGLSLPAPDSDFYGPDRLLIFDEITALSPILTSTQTLSHSDLSKIVSLLLDNNAAIEVLKVLNSISQRAKASHHGLNLKDFPEIKEISIEALKALEPLLQNDISELNSEHGVDLNDMPSELKMRYAKSEEYIDKIADMVPAFIPNLIAVIQGDGTAIAGPDGSLSFLAPTLMREAILKCHVIVMDATVQPDELSAMFGGVAVRTVKSNSTPGAAKIIKIKTSSFTMNRSEGQRTIARTMAESIIATHSKLGHKVGIMDSQKFFEDYDGLDAVIGAKFVNHRGSNIFGGCNVFVMVGQMRLSVNAVQANFDMLSLRGYEKTFEQYYAERVRQENDQAFGRLRANRRHGEDLYVYILDGTWDGHFDNELSTEKLISDRATGMALKIVLLAKAIDRLGKTSYRELAKSVGCSHSRVGDLLPYALELINSPSYEEMLNIIISSDVDEEVIIEVINEIILCISNADEESDEETLEWSYEYEYEPDS